MLDNQGYYEPGDNADHHRELRLDIEDMSYEVNDKLSTVCSFLPLFV